MGASMEAVWKRDGLRPQSGLELHVGVVFTVDLYNVEAESHYAAGTSSEW